MSAETHTRGLCLSVNVTVGQQIIPALMSEDAGMITQQRGECWQTQPAVLAGQAGAAPALHNQKNRKEKNSRFSQIL